MKKALLTMLLCAALTVSGCAASRNPLIRAEATDVPGLSMALHAAAASKANADTVTVTLYYRYLSQPMLASESRTLSVKRDETPELALIRALLEGPSAENAELTRLFPETVSVKSVTAQGSLLFVTLSSALLSGGGEQDVTLSRTLMAQSLVASVTESFSYTGVQLMISTGDDPRADARLPASFFVPGRSGVSEPIARDESCLLTPQATARQILDAWSKRDLETLYAYVAAFSEAGQKPVFETFVGEADAQLKPLSSFALSAGSVSADGQHAVLTANLTFTGTKNAIAAYPMPLMRENGIWKVSYQTLFQMLGKDDTGL